MRVDRIKLLMDEKGWNNSDLAAHADVKYDTVYALLERERPGSKVTAETVARFALAFGVSIEFLMGLSETRQIIVQEVNSVLHELLRDASNLPLSKQIELQKLAVAIRGNESISDQVQDMLLSAVERWGGKDELDRLLLALRRLPPVE